MIGHYTDGKEFYRCAEGARLYQAWVDALRIDASLAPTLALMEISSAWIAYQAHVRACAECTQDLSENLTDCTQDGE